MENTELGIDSVEYSVPKDVTLELFVDGDKIDICNIDVKYQRDIPFFGEKTKSIFRIVATTK